MPIYWHHYPKQCNHVMISLNLPVKIGLRHIQCPRVSFQIIGHYRYNQPISKFDFLGKSTWGTLHKRSERTSYEVKHILESDEDPSIVPYGANLRRIYEACMDTEEVDQQGAKPAQAFITDNFSGWSWDRKG